MLVKLFFALRAAAIPVSVTELLTLLEALQARAADQSTRDFYFLARASLVKDERYYDRFDRVFAEVFEGAERVFADLLAADIPAEWLRGLTDEALSGQQRRAIEEQGGWEKLLATLRERLREQDAAHHGGSKWIGTGGTSPFGAAGYHPEGIRFGDVGARQGRAVKVWERREFRNFDDTIELGTRNMKVALRRLRRFAREGVADQLDLDGTIAATARNAGLLELKLVPQRRNAVKVLLFLDVGGSMDEHVSACEELFSAARAEFKYLEHFYFHNVPYEWLWKDNHRRAACAIATLEVLRTYGHDYRVILVGDATMSPYEILQPGGSVEHWNEEAGAVWMQRLCAAFPRLVWLNPASSRRWAHADSVRILQDLVGGRMFPLTLQGLDAAIAILRHGAAVPKISSR